MTILGPLALIGLSLTTNALVRAAKDVGHDGSPASPQPAPTPVGPLDLSKGALTCPGRGRGWSLTVLANPTAYDVEWTTRPEGPYATTSPTSSSGGWNLVTSQPSSTKVFLRARPKGSTADEWSMAMYTMPAQAC